MNNRHLQCSALLACGLLLVIFGTIDLHKRSEMHRFLDYEEVERGARSARTLATRKEAPARTASSPAAAASTHILWQVNARQQDSGQE